MEKDDNKLLREFSGAVRRPFGFRSRGPVVKRLLTISEAAGLLGIKSQTLYVWVSQKRVPHRKIGRLVRFTESDLEEFISRQRQQPTDPEDGALSTR